jgi:hypothetical protein
MNEKELERVIMKNLKKTVTGVKKDGVMVNTGKLVDLLIKDLKDRVK